MLRLVGVTFCMLIQKKLKYYPLLLHDNLSVTRLSCTSLDSDWQNIDMIHDTA